MLGEVAGLAACCSTLLGTNVLEHIRICTLRLQHLCSNVLEHMRCSNVLERIMILTLLLHAGHMQQCAGAHAMCKVVHGVVCVLQVNPLMLAYRGWNIVSAHLHVM